MTIQVRLNLPLCFGQKTQIPGITKFACDYSDRQGTSIPERIQHAFSTSQLNKPTLRPSQMLTFFLGGTAQGHLN